MTNSQTIRDLESNEIDSVSGGIVPIVVIPWAVMAGASLARGIYMGYQMNKE